MTELLRLSVLDQSPVAEGSTGSQALQNTIDLARLTDGLGYHRYWVAEHHGIPGTAEGDAQAGADEAGADDPNAWGHDAKATDAP